MKNILKHLVIYTTLLLINYSCQKEDGISEQLGSDQQTRYTAPSIDIAKTYFENNSQYSTGNDVSLRVNNIEPYVDWQVSKNKRYKQTPEQNVDILYTPRYIQTDMEIKSFVATTVNGDEVHSKIFAVLYKDIKRATGLSAYVLIYNLEGQLETAYNYQNGIQVPFPNIQTEHNHNAREFDCSEIGVTLAELEEWAANCNGNVLGEVVIIATPTTDNTPHGGNQPIFDNPLGLILNIPPISGPEDLDGNGGGVWWTANTLTPEGLAIMEAILPVASPDAIEWLQNGATAEILEAMADYLNANTVRGNPISGNDDTLGSNEEGDFNQIKIQNTVMKPLKLL